MSQANHKYFNLGSHACQWVQSSLVMAFLSPLPTAAMVFSFPVTSNCHASVYFPFGDYLFCRLLFARHLTILHTTSIGIIDLSLPLRYVLMPLDSSHQQEHQ